MKLPCKTLDGAPWGALRSRGVGGSDVAAICGISPWKTAYQVWLEKTGQSEGQEQNEAMAYGTMIEPVIRNWYEQAIGEPVTMPSGILVHPEHNFMLANLDGYRSDRVVEIKTARSGSDWGEPGTDEIPVYYRTQGEHYMMVTGLTLCDFVVSFHGTMPVVYTIEADPELQEMILERESEFWEMVKNGTPPAPVTLQDMLAAFPKSQGKPITATSEIEALVSRIKSIKAESETLEGEFETIKAEIMGYMGNSDTLLDIAGKPILTWKSSRDGKTFDVSRFKADFPETYELYLKDKPGVRRFLPK